MIDFDAEYLCRIEAEAHLKPFKSLMHALNTSVSFQAGQVDEAERSMFRAGAVCLISAGIAVAAYLSSHPLLAALSGFIAAFFALKFSVALGARNAFASEVALMESRLLEAGFSLTWSKDLKNSHRPTNVTLDWPAQR